MSLSNLQKVYQAITRMAKTSEVPAEQAIERVKLLQDYIDPSRYAPSTLARAALEKPAAQKGFSEALGSTKKPFASTLIRPSQWAQHTPELDPYRDRNIIEYLKKVLPEEKLKELPFMWINDRPSGLEAGYEGRHRMKAMQELYGDDPVLTNLLRGDKFEMRELSYPKGMIDETAVDENRMSPLEMLKRQIMMGDKPIDINPLWIGK